MHLCWLDCMHTTGEQYRPVILSIYTCSIYTYNYTPYSYLKTCIWCIYLPLLSPARTAALLWTSALTADERSAPLPCAVSLHSLSYRYPCPLLLPALLPAPVQPCVVQTADWLQMRWAHSLYQAHLACRHPRTWGHVAPAKIQVWISRCTLHILRIIKSVLVS